jgi:hypothetical protein
MLQSSERELRGYIKSKVVSGKYWMVGRDQEVCSICQVNKNAGVIPLDAKFPSGHMYPPAGKLCRCALMGMTDENA